MQSVKLLESVSVTALGLLDRFSFAESWSCSSLARRFRLNWLFL